MPGESVVVRAHEVAMVEPDSGAELAGTRFALCYVFISYRWQGAEHEHWVRRFADGLVARGYPVVLDQHLMEAPDLMGRSRVDQLLVLFQHLARATHFVPILTDSYRRRLIHGDGEESGERWENGWVYDEWTVAVTKSSKSRDLTFMGIWRSGDRLPGPFTPDNACDFRDDDLDGNLDRWFPPFLVVVVALRDGSPVRKHSGPG